MRVNIEKYWHVVLTSCHVAATITTANVTHLMKPIKLTVTRRLTQYAIT